MAKPISEKLTIKRLKLPPKFRPIAGKVMDNGAAAEAGLKANDEIISLGGLPVGGQGQLISALQENGTNKTEIVVRREGSEMTFPITPKDVKGVIMIGIQFAPAPADLHREESGADPD